MGCACNSTGLSRRAFKMREYMRELCCRPGKSQKDSRDNQGEVKLGGPPLAVLKSPVRTSFPSDSSADSLECSQARALDCCLKAS